MKESGSRSLLERAIIEKRVVASSTTEMYKSSRELAVELGISIKLVSSIRTRHGISVREMKIKKVCKGCHKTFFAETPQRLYCSAECFKHSYYLNHRKLEMRTGKCEQCGKEFVKARSFARFCSPTCGHACHDKQKNSELLWIRTTHPEIHQEFLMVIHE